MASITLGNPSPALEQLRNSSVAQPNLHASFSSLPAEIQHLIWDFTFSPRTIHIRIHEGPTPSKPLASAAHSWEAGQVLKTACISFTAVDGLIESPHPSSFNSPRPNRRPGLWTLDWCWAKPPPRGPVALYVCHESRSFALKHYELAFAGTNLQPSEDTEFAEAWQKTGYGEKRIWVNFRLDTIFIGMSYFNQYRHNHLGEPKLALVLLTCYAKEEVKKIRRLAVGEMFCKPRAFPGTAPASQLVWRHLPEQLKQFERLEKLLIYHVDTEVEVVKRLKEDIMALLEEEKRRCPEWKADLPEVEVREGNRYWIFFEL